MPLTTDDVVDGRYRVLHQLGEGAISRVYLAEVVGSSEKIAIKCLREHLAEDPTWARRSEREIAALARIAHPNVVQVVGTGSLGDGSPYLAMELLSGHDVMQDVLSHGPMDWRRACGVALQLAQALTAVHAAGVVHRDVKPSNVQLMPDGRGAERVKLLDFGFAIGGATFGQDQRLTNSGEVVGTPHYMSPEQARGQPATASSDLYALGCVLFLMIVGHPPFRGDDAMRVMLAHCYDVAPTLSSARPGQPAELEALLGGLLSKAPGDRPDGSQLTGWLRQIERAG